MAEDKKSPILVIDDEDEARNSLKSYLEKRGYEVLTAANGEEGLQQMVGRDIEIVLCDIMMPKLDGMEFLKRVRQYNLKTEVIMITGQSTVERCVNALENGACQYLTKPVRLEEIVLSIERAKRNIGEKQEMICRALKNKKNSQG